MTLEEAIALRLRQSRLMGQRLSRRRMIEVDADGRAVLRLGWINDAGLARVEAGDDPQIDMKGLPPGIEVHEWTAPDDTIDALDPPPTIAAELPEISVSAICRVPLTCRMPPPAPASGAVTLLSVIWQRLRVSDCPALKMPPPSKAFAVHHQVMTPSIARRSPI